MFAVLPAGSSTRSESSERSRQTPEEISSNICQSPHTGKQFRHTFGGYANGSKLSEIFELSTHTLRPSFYAYFVLTLLQNLYKWFVSTRGPLHLVQFKLQF